MSDNSYSGVEDTGGSALNLTTEVSEGTEVVRERFRPVSRTAEAIVDVLNEPPAR